MPLAAAQGTNPGRTPAASEGVPAAGACPRSPFPVPVPEPTAGDWRSGHGAESPGPAGSCRRGRTAAPGAPRAGRGQRCGCGCGSGGAGAEPPRPLCVRGRGSGAAAILCRPGPCPPGLRGAAPGPRSCTEGPSGASPRSPRPGPVPRLPLRTVRSAPRPVSPPQPERRCRRWSGPCPGRGRSGGRGQRRSPGGGRPAGEEHQESEARPRGAAAAAARPIRRAAGDPPRPAASRAAAAAP